MEYLRTGHREEKERTVGEANVALGKISTIRSNILTQETKINQNIKEYVEAGVLIRNRTGLLETPELASLSREQSSSLQKWVSNHNRIIKDIQNKKELIDHTEARLRGFRKMTKKELREEKPNSQTRPLPGKPVEEALRRTEERLGQKWVRKMLGGAGREGKRKTNETERLRELLESPKLEQPAQSAKPAKPAPRTPRRRAR